MSRVDYKRREGRGQTRLEVLFRFFLLGGRQFVPASKEDTAPRQFRNNITAVSIRPVEPALGATFREYG